MSSQRIAPIDNPVLTMSPLLAELSGLELNAVAAFLEPRSVKKDEIIFYEGTAGQEMFILVSGRIGAWVKQSDGMRRWLFELNPGDFFGEMSVIAHESRSATLSARLDTELMVLPGIDFYRIIFDHPMIGVKMLRAIGKVQTTWLEQVSKSLGDLMRWGEKARRRAISDELTGLYNRRFLEESGKDRFAHGSVGRRNISFMMIDLDKIHEVNTKYGSRAGDLLFIAMGEVLRKVTRAGDICARLSGDEFSVLLPDTEHGEALEIAERICMTVFSRKVAVPKSPGETEQTEITVSASIGIAAAPAHADSWEGLLLAADKALRRAKELGRNRAELASG